MAYCVKHGIPVLRRISGGGTVYHDRGNINFSFFRPADEKEPINYLQNLQIVQQALQELGYPVEINDRHDLVLEGFKISGNAQHVRKKRALHHGTLLYDADIEVLRQAIKRSSGEVLHKAVNSVRSRSRNLRSYLDLGPVPAFVGKLEEVLAAICGKPAFASTPPSRALGELVENRYRQEAWNYGYGPAYILQRSLRIGGNTHQIQLEVARGGRINKCLISPASPHSEQFIQLLEGEYHFPHVIRERLDGSEWNSFDYVELF